MIELLFFIAAGILLGVFTGLAPGIHVNTVSILLLGFSFINPHYIVITIIATAITHTIFDFIPSIFLGAPDPSTSLSVLPGHQLLMEGRGIQAVYLTTTGAVVASILAVALMPLMLVFIPLLYQSIGQYIHYILVAIAVSIIFSSKGITAKLVTASIFLLSGLLGVITLQYSVLPSQMILFPIFTGLFGMSTLMFSLRSQAIPPPQKPKTHRIPRKLLLSGSLKGLLSGSILGVLPGVGAAEAATLTQQITKKKDSHEFLVSIGAINTIVALFSLASLYTISKARSGAAVAVDQLIDFGFNDLLLLVAVTMVSVGISAFIMVKSFRHIAGFMQKINYTLLTRLTIMLLVVLTLLFTGLYGLLVLAVSTSIGMIAPLFNVRRSIAMGVLMLPLILFYAGIQL